jgi:hypothetical protein
MNEQIFHDFYIKFVMINMKRYIFILFLYLDQISSQISQIEIISFFWIFKKFYHTIFFYFNSIFKN